MSQKSSSWAHGPTTNWTPGPLLGEQSNVTHIRDRAACQSTPPAPPHGPFSHSHPARSGLCHPRLSPTLIVSLRPGCKACRVPVQGLCAHLPMPSGSPRQERFLQVFRLCIRRISPQRYQIGCAEPRTEEAGWGGTGLCPQTGLSATHSRQSPA